MAGGYLSKTPAWLVSMVLHVAVLLSLALIVTPPPQEHAGIRTIDSPPTEGLDEVEQLETVELPSPDDQESVEEEQDLTQAPNEIAVESVEVSSDASDLAAASEMSVDVSDISTDISMSTDLLKTVSKSGGTKTGFAARSNAASQKEMIKAGGGNPDEVIRAVENACDWFKRHQMPDGGWSFDCSQVPGCMGQCGVPKSKGHLKNRMAATALALLPMLGQGYTHTAKGAQGKYAPQIEMGLAFLSRQVIQKKGASGDGMYTQGLTGIALSEAFGMTKDERLLLPAQAAIDYIIMAQDPVGGGWGYSPRTPGDTSIVCWQVMALKSGIMSGLRVDPGFVPGLSNFLDSVQSDDGAGYGYRAPGDTAALTPAGLLCRMFSTWKKTNDALIRGAKKTFKRGPSRDMYASYYATQVLFHLKKQLPEEWDSWQKQMSKMLLDSQITSGHMAGSFLEGFEHGHAAEVAGRIYVTSMATMTLEVYFKHGLPLYQDAGEEADDFAE